jgi:hypothetical protein
MVAQVAFSFAQLPRHLFLTTFNQYLKIFHTKSTPKVTPKAIDLQY